MRSVHYSYVIRSILILIIIISFVFLPHIGIKTFALAKDDNISKSSGQFRSSQANNSRNIALSYSSSPSSSSIHHNDILTIYNTSQTVSFVGEVNTSDLTRPQFKPFVDTSSNQSYLTKDYAAYKAAKNESELIRPNTRVFEVHLTSPSSIISSSSLSSMQQDDDNNNRRAVHSTTNHSENFVIDNNRRHSDGPQYATATTQINQSGSIGSLTGFEGLSQNCCSPPDVQVAASSEGPSNYIVEMVNLDGAIYTKSGTLIKAFGLNEFFNPSDNSFSKSNDDDLTDPLLLFDDSSGRWFASISDTTTEYSHSCF